MEEENNNVVDPTDVVDAEEANNTYINGNQSDTNDCANDVPDEKDDHKDEIEK